MVCHELATNAAKYGALSVPEGRVEISWEVTLETTASRTLRLRWAERGGPPAAPPTQRGFGSRLVEQIVRHQLNGSVRLRYEAEGLVCELEIPLETHADTAQAAE
jgi:two-component sensor histidine kinase